MSAFKRTNTKIFQKPIAEESSDAKYWKGLGTPVLIKEFGPVDYIHFSPANPYYFAVTSSAHVQLYNPITKQVVKNISNFKETAYGAVFRRDGQLLCAGGEESTVRLFEVATKTPLRVFRGHTSAVHRCFFSRDKVHLASFSDDKTVRLWDIATESEVTKFAEHDDYVRAGAVSPVSNDIVLSGGYDNFVRMYDTRTEKSVIQVDHGAPVESVIFLPSGGIFLSAGGTEIRVWDAFASGRMLAKVNSHHKTITCMCLSSKSKRLFSGSLDKQVKIYDLATYSVVHTLDYPNSILSMGISAGGSEIVVGMIDGLVSVTSREEKEESHHKKPKKFSYQFAAEAHTNQSGVEVVNMEAHHATHSKVDTCLRKFEYSKALQVALGVRKFPHVFMGVAVQLMRRKGLKQALAGQDDAAIAVLLKFIIKHIGNQQFTRILIDVANTFLEVHDDDDFSPEVMELVITLSSVLRNVENLTEDLLSLQGAMQMLLAAANVGDNRVSVQRSADATDHLQPSEQAQKMLTINLT